ncbi:MAG TPA: serine/threonine-protein kinase [Burkholderiales bacterium]|nr:serine/threonine-protein kinase [Burkholderiales bacterium]
MSLRGDLAQIGKYPVMRKLGEGATSEVYLCSDPFNLRDVAIKVAFAEALRDPTRGKICRKLFLTEAKLAGKLQHPHICQIYDAVAEENLHYLVMEYVDGGTLEKYCRPETLPPVERTVEIIFKCTRALEFAQKLGVTRRDIKPANILHAGETDVKLTDFGAPLIATRDTTQVAGVGSPAYMSPEQVKDLPLDGRAQEFADSDRFETLRRLPFFEHLSDAELWEVGRISTWRHATAGETIMKEGEPFGEMAYLSRKEHARGAEVTVGADASIISVPTQSLNQASDGCRHKFDRAFMAILVERLAAANLRLSGV